MRYAMIMIVSFLAGSLLFQYVNHAHGAETKKQEELACAKNDDIEKIMEEKGYSLLLNMTRKENNKEGIIESLWVGGQNAVITASVPNAESSCFIANMNNVIINPNAVEGIWEAYKKQSKQKDI